MALTRPRAYQIYDIDYKQATRVVTTTNISLSGGAPSIVDSISLAANDRVLVTGQTSGAQNGIYIVQTLGTGANGTWTRSTDTNATGELLSGTIVMVTEGAVYQDTQWKLTTDDPITIGVTALTFVQNYSANSISSGGTSFAIGSANANATISVSAVSNIAVFSPTTVTFAANVIPNANITYSLGSTTNRWKDLWLSNSTLYLGNITLGATATQLTVGGANVITADASGNVSTTGNITGGNILTGGIVSATGAVAGLELTSTQSSGDEGGQVNLSIPATNTTLTGQVTIDVFQNKLRFFQGDSAKGAYIDLTAAGAGVGSNLLAGGGGGTPGGSNTMVQFNDGSTFGGNGQFVYDKVTNTLTAGIISANNNGSGTNFKVGDDAWIGDINTADTIGIKGQQNAANAYIVFGNSDATGKLGRAGTGPLTYAGAFSATGNVTGGNVLTGGLVSATGNITSSGNIAGGNVLATTTVSAASHIGATVSITGTMTAASTVGGVITGSSVSVTGNVTGVGAAISGNISGGNLLTGGLISATGNITSAANVAGGNLLGTTTVSAASHIGTIVSVTANVTGGNVLTGGLISATGQITGSQFNGSGAGLTAIPGANVTGTLSVNTTGYAATVSSAAQPNITSVGTLSSLTVTANVTGGNLLTGGLISATSSITSAANINGGNANITTQINTTSVSASGNVRTAGTVSATGNINGGNLISAGTITTAGNIVSSAANATANIGSATTYFNVVHAKATSAQYADVAERYISDVVYPPGTVVAFGGIKEVTIANVSHSVAVAGVVSTNPAYIMNAGAAGDAIAEVALLGRVPCRVTGTITKGDRIVTSSIPGVAQALDPALYQPGCIIGKALESYTQSGVGTIEVVVGRI